MGHHKKDVVSVNVASTPPKKHVEPTGEVANLIPMGGFKGIHDYDVKSATGDCLIVKRLRAYRGT